jgi:hypothetical protein
VDALRSKWQQQKEKEEEEEEREEEEEEETEEEKEEKNYSHQLPYLTRSNKLNIFWLRNRTRIPVV